MLKAVRRKEITWIKRYTNSKVCSRDFRESCPRWKPPKRRCSTIFEKYDNSPPVVVWCSPTLCSQLAWQAAPLGAGSTEAPAEGEDEEDLEDDEVIRGLSTSGLNPVVTEYEKLVQVERPLEPLSSNKKPYLNQLLRFPIITCSRSLLVPTFAVLCLQHPSSHDALC